jgi:hypothetical protein
MAAAATIWDPRIYYGLPNWSSLEGAGPSDVISCPADAADFDIRDEHELQVFDTVGAAKTEHVGPEAAALNGSKIIGEDVYWKDVRGTWGDRNTWWTRFHDPTTLAWSEWAIWKHVPVLQRFQ